MCVGGGGGGCVRACVRASERACACMCVFSSSGIVVETAKPSQWQSPAPVSGTVQHTDASRVFGTQSGAGYSQTSLNRTHPFSTKYPDRRGNRIIEHTYCMYAWHML